MLVIVLYVVESYQDLDHNAGSLFSRGFRWEDYAIVTAVLFFLVDWLMRFYSAANRKYFCLTFDTFVDMITILPVVVELAGQIDDLSYFRQFQLWRLFRILKSRTPSVLYIGEAQNRDYVAHEVSKLIAFVCITLSISAACFMEIENRLSGKCWGDCIDVKRDPPITIFQSMYYVIVTMTTVGYGDYYPTSDWGRLFCVFLLFFLIFTIPVKIGEFTELMNHYSMEQVMSAGVGTRAVVILCDPTDPGSIDLVFQICREIFHPDHEMLLSVVIVGEVANDQRLELFMANPLYCTRIFYIHGSFTAQDTFERVKLFKAIACIILSKLGLDPSLQDEADYKNIMTSITIRKYCAQLAELNKLDSVCMPVICQLQHAKMARHLHINPFVGYTNVTAIDVNDLSTGLAAKDLMCPGASIFLTTILTCFNSKDYNYEDQPKTGQWSREFLTGANNDLYIIDVPIEADGWTLNQLALEAYAQLNIMVIASVALPIEGKLSSVESMVNSSHGVKDALDIGAVNMVSNKVLYPQLAATNSCKQSVFVIAWDYMHASTLAAMDFERKEKNQPVRGRLRANSSKYPSPPPADAESNQQSAASMLSARSVRKTGIYGRHCQRDLEASCRLSVAEREPKDLWNIPTDLSGHVVVFCEHFDHMENLVSRMRSRTEPTFYPIILVGKNELEDKAMLSFVLFDQVWVHRGLATDARTLEEVHVDRAIKVAMLDHSSESAQNKTYKILAVQAITACNPQITIGDQSLVTAIPEDSLDHCLPGIQQVGGISTLTEYERVAISSNMALSEAYVAHAILAQCALGLNAASIVSIMLWGKQSSEGNPTGCLQMYSSLPCEWVNDKGQAGFVAWNSVMWCKFVSPITSDFL